MDWNYTFRICIRSDAQYFGLWPNDPMKICIQKDPNGAKSGLSAR